MTVGNGKGGRRRAEAVTEWSTSAFAFCSGDMDVVPEKLTGESDKRWRVVTFLRIVRKLLPAILGSAHSFWRAGRSRTLFGSRVPVCDVTHFSVSAECNN